MTSDDTTSDKPADNPTAGPSVRSPAKTAQRDLTRQQLLLQRKQLNPASVALQSNTISAGILPLLGDSARIGAYLAFGQEVIVDDLMTECRAQGRSTYVPLIQSDNTLVFAPLTDSTVIVHNKYGIREPLFEQASCLPATALDIVIVPLLGFDAKCQRMGMGGGYYDRTFAFKLKAQQQSQINPSPLLIGVAFESQCVASVFPDWWDVTLDYVITEKHIHSRNEAIRPVC